MAVGVWDEAPQELVRARLNEQRSNSKSSKRPLGAALSDMDHEYDQGRVKKVRARESLFDPDVAAFNPYQEIASNKRKPQQVYEYGSSRPKEIEANSSSRGGHRGGRR